MIVIDRPNLGGQPGTLEGVQEAAYAHPPIGPPVIFYAVTADGEFRVTYVSPNVEKLTGLPAASVLGSPNFFGDRVHTDDLNGYLQALESLKTHGEATIDYRLRHVDGSYRCVRDSLRLRECRDGRASEIIASIVELTETKRREPDFRPANEILEDAIECLAEGFALYDADDRLVMCNRRYKEFNPQSADILVPGIEWSDFVRIGAERGQYVSAIGRVDQWLVERARERADARTNLEYQQSDGSWFRFSNRRTRQGGLVVTRTDITAQKEMEQALRDSEALIRKVVETNPLPLTMCCCEDGQILFESPAYKALFGRENASTQPTSSREYYVDPSVRPALIERLLEAGRVDDCEVRLKRADGSQFWASVSCRLIEYHGKAVAVSSVVDLTERKAIEEELTRQREALHQTEKLSAMGSLLAGVAHELNNPLAVVVGHALLLQESSQDPKISNRAEKIGSAAERCSRIVKTFLAMARQQRSERVPVNVNEIIESTLDVTGYTLSTAGIEVDLDLEEGLPAVSADPDQLNQVLSNLIINAQHAMADQSNARHLRIASAYDRLQGCILMSVTDSGPGISADIQSRVFEPFFTTKDVGAGTGVGLAVCHKVIELLGGRISVKSDPGKGATFTITLPVANADPTPAVTQIPAKPPARGFKVLVIDDEIEVARMLQDVLAAQEHVVTIACSGGKALDILAKQEFDVILSDVRMPNLDGPQLYRAIKDLSPGLLGRVAFVTGDTFSPSARAFLTQTGRPHLQKPFTPSEVQQLIERVTANPRVQRLRA